MKDTFQLTQAPPASVAALDPTRHRRSATIVTVAVSLILTLGSFFIADSMESQKQKALARVSATRLQLEIAARLRDYETLVEHVNGLFAIKQELSPGDLSLYLDRLDREKIYPALVRLALARADWAVPDRTEGDPTLTIRRIDPRTDATDPLIGEPLLPRANLDDVLNDLLVRGDRIAILPDGPTGLDNEQISLIAPLYSALDLPTSENLRKEKFVGVTAGRIDLQKLLAEVVNNTDIRVENIRILLQDRRQPLTEVEDIVIARSRQAARFTIPLISKASDDALSLQLDILHAKPPAFSSSNLILGVGAFFTVLLGLLTWLITTRREDAVKQLEEVEEQNKIRLVLLRELNHRVKNVMATVVSLASLSRRYATTVDDYYEDFSARVSALSSAHSVLIQSEWHGARITDLIQAESTAYGHVNGDRFILDGPDVELKPSAALTLGLAFHELTTNAAKYGALSNETGRITIGWTFTDIEGRSHIRIEWRESGGPPVSPPDDKKGFGSLLLEKLTARELSGTVNISYSRSGVECDIVMDWEKVRARAKANAGLDNAGANDEVSEAAT